MDGPACVELFVGDELELGCKLGCVLCILGAEEVRDAADNVADPEFISESFRLRRFCGCDVELGCRREGGEAGVGCA